MKISFLLLATFRGRGCSSSRPIKICGDIAVFSPITSISGFFSLIRYTVTTVTFYINKTIKSNTGKRYNDVTQHEKVGVTVTMCNSCVTLL